MVKIRLQRRGRKNYAQYRVVAADTRRARDGKCIEVLGWYNPHAAEEANTSINLDRADHWVSVGAQVSPSVKQLIKRARRKEIASAQG